MKSTAIPAEVRQLEKVLQGVLIPLAQSGAPVVWMGTPPRCGLPTRLESQHTTPLWDVPVVIGFNRARRWEERQVNSVEVPIIGCILEGKVDYRVHTPPGQLGMQWTVPVQKNQIFFIPPDAPFSDGSDPDMRAPYARGMLIYLQRDGISCLRYTMDKGKLWRRPYIFLHEPEALLPGERLFRELQRDGGHAGAIAYHYLSIVLQLMMRAIKGQRYATLRVPRNPGASRDFMVGGESGGADLVGLVTEHIDHNLENSQLDVQQLGLQAGVSVGHLNRLFKAEMGLTPYQYLQQQRLAKARHLLEHSNLQIRQVAELAGFQDQAHFTHWFARQVGVSPTGYRRGNRTED